MPTLTLTKTYDEFATLSKSDLDNWLTDLEEFLNETKLNDANIQTVGVSADLSIKDNTIAAAKVATAAVTLEKVAASGISDSNCFNALSVSTAKLAALSITTSKIADGAVTLAVIQNGTFSKIKQDSINAAGIDSANNSTYTAETVIHTSQITTTGRSVQVIVSPSQTPQYTQQTGASGAAASGASTDASVNTTDSNTSFSNRIRIYRGATLISDMLTGMVRAVTLGSGTAYLTIPNSLVFLDVTPAAGTYTYTISITSTNADAVAMRLSKIYLREL